MHMQGGEEFEPFAFVRKDGSIATALGSFKAVLLLEGQRLPTTILSSDKANRRCSGDIIDKMFYAEKSEPMRSTVAQWRDYAGPPFEPSVTEEECDSCKGSGEKECYACGHENECEDCEGTGKMEGVTEWPECHRVIVIDKRYDPRLLAPLLAMVPDGEVKVSVGKNTFLYIVGDGWKIMAADWRDTETPAIQFKETA